MKTPEMLDALFRSATEGIIVTDRQGKIVLVNPRAIKHFGYEEQELIGQTIELLVPSRFVNMHSSHREDYHKHPRPRSMGAGMNLFAKRKDGSEFPVEVSLSHFSTSEGPFVMKEIQV